MPVRTGGTLCGPVMLRPKAGPEDDGTAWAERGPFRSPHFFGVVSVLKLSRTSCNEMQDQIGRAADNRRPRGTPDGHTPPGKKHDPRHLLYPEAWTCRRVCREKGSVVGVFCLCHLNHHCQPAPSLTIYLLSKHFVCHSLAGMPSFCKIWIYNDLIVTQGMRVLEEAGGLSELPTKLCPEFGLGIPLRRLLPGIYRAKAFARSSAMWIGAASVRWSIW